MKVPPSLKPNDTVGLVSPARVISKSQIDFGLKILEGWGLNVVLGEHIFQQEGYFAGTDDMRLSDVQKMLDNTEIKALLCTRGGYGVTRILDQLDFSKFRNSPKWVVGFSDITALHLKSNSLGFSSLHSIMPVQYGNDGINKSLDTLRSFLFGDELDYSWAPHPDNVQGVVKAEVIGGNLSLITESIGTATEIDTTNKILLIEEIDEYLYKVDRMMNQLERAGKFENLSGVIIGQFSDMKDTTIPFGCNIHELLLKYFNSKKLPLVINAPIGHTADNWAIPLGYRLKLEVGDKEVKLTS